MNSNEMTGDADLPAPAPRPSATLCILCFNQEHYVGEALRAALRQTGDPIEIIVSDDGSSDGTLDVAREIAACYQGPHRVIVRQTPHNLGTLNHVFNIAELATGDLIVIGAADDMSLPGRVATLVDAWRRDRSAALFSSYQIIDETDAVLEDFHRFDDRSLPIHDYLPQQALVSIHGASSAYDRKALLALPRPSTPILFEDTWLTLMLTLLDHRISYVDQALVAYRRHAESITNFGERGGNTGARIEAADARGRRSAAAYRDAIRSFRDQALAAGLGPRLAMEVIDRDLRFFEAQVAWPTLPWRAKLTAARQARQPWMRRWALLRLFGPRLRVAIATARQLARRRHV